MPVVVLIGAILAAGFIHEDPVADRLVRQTLEATYELRLDEARRTAETLQQQYPRHPAGFVLIAETYWWEAQADPGNTRIEDAYYEAQESARAVAEAALARAEYPRIEILSYLASAHGSYARFQVTQKEAYFSALRAGLQAHGYARDVHQLDPDFYDVYVGLGAFNYFTGSLPAAIKPFAFLIGIRGDRDTGLEQLRIAREQSRYSRTEARIVSYTALLEDGQYQAAMDLLEELRRDYPTNHVLFVWLTDWYLRQGRSIEAIQAYDRIAGVEREVRPQMAQFALLEKAWLEQATGRARDARATVARIRALPDRDPLVVKKLRVLDSRLR